MICQALADASDLSLVGGKARNLGALVRGGFAVPGGFVVTTDAYVEVVGRGARTARDFHAGMIPPHIAADIAASLTALGPGPVAVRSSATAEDLPGAAFAGQQESVLDVSGVSGVLAAIATCWASLWSQRAVAYRDRLGIDPDEVTIAVVVQRMVAAEWAGVAFTADPVSGRRDRLVVDAHPGTGEAVVSGAVTPEHLLLKRDGTVAARRAGERGAQLPAGILRDLVGTLGRIAALWDAPQDVEWACDARRLWILQARPMTALPPAPVRLNVVQRTLGSVLAELVPRRPWPMEMSAWISAAVLPHAAALGEGMAGVRLPVQALLHESGGVVDAFSPPNPRLTWRTPARVARSIRRAIRGAPSWRADPDLAAFRAQIARLDDLDVGSAGWTQLLATQARIVELIAPLAEVRTRYLPRMVPALIRLNVVTALLGLRRIRPDLTRGARTVTREANEQLEHLAELWRERGRSAAFETAFAAFLARFGARETGSVLMLRDPSWGADPAVPLGLVRLMASGPIRHRIGDDQRRAHALAAMRRNWLVRLRPRTGDRIQHWAEVVREAYAMREDSHFDLVRPMPILRAVVGEAGRRLALAGQLDHPDDVWLLRWDELPAEEPGRADADALRRIVTQRRATWVRLGGSPLIAPASLRARAPAAGALASGVAGGGGVVTARVRQISGPDAFEQLQPGEVLVCRATNPSWTPLFARAAAVVVDLGGMAAHAAIVAREYGLPAVLATGNATTVLRDGQLVRVDGIRGVVTAAEDAW